MKRILLLLIILTPFLSISQNNNPKTYSISGKIIDAESKIPIELASIIFKNLNSNVIKYGAITNSRGNFSIDVEEGTYNATVEYISYKTKKLNISNITKDFNLGTILLELDTEFLKEVEIVAEKKAVEFKPNKIVFHVAKDIVSSSGVATDVLNNIPSVSVDSNGNITVQGQSHVQVMINGRTSSMSGVDALKSLPAGAIENIEVITNPGAQYSSSALSVINIILKKGKDQGLNASLTATAGHKDYSGGLFTLNNKDEKINFFINSSYNKSNPIKNSFLESEYFENNNTISFLNEGSEFNNKREALYGTIGTDFYLSKRSTLTTSINYQKVINKSNTLTNSEIFDNTYNFIESNDRNHNGKLTNEMIEFISDFTHNFKKEGKSLTAYISHTKDIDNVINSIENTNPNFTNEYNKEKNKLTNNSFEVKYVSPVNKTSTYTLGVKGNYYKIPFKYISGLEINNINYTENVTAAFIEFENESEKFYYGLGLRTEFMELKANYLTLNEVQKNNYNEILPSAYFEYSLSDFKSLSLSLSRKLATPGYSSLQPYEQKYSETSSYIGNPALKPIYIDAANLSYTYYGTKITFAPSLFYQKFKGYWQEVTYETGEQINTIKKVITTPINLGKVDYYGVNLNTMYKPNQFLNFTANFNLVNFDQTGTFKTINAANEIIILDYNKASIDGSFSLLTQIKIPKVFNFQINAKHHLISEGSYSTRKAYTYASAAINKDLFNNDASFSLRVDDLFLSNEIDRNRFNTNYFSKSLIKNKYRTILFSFTYRFNQSKKDRQIDFNKKDLKPNF
ncbi:TonB-dependent receptor domain-containing protein [Lutibacter aestuarii]|uniref:TonB-dependent receptor domain-containing protein n=1 Tax=Lutibacter aestuarii TaxID=861111 RepID=A0ABW2Z5B7_9FLAO|nr:outer membrane beta-barrel family protein [uncultured Lutibacter sp.]